MCNMLEYYETIRRANGTNQGQCVSRRREQSCSCVWIQLACDSTSLASTVCDTMTVASDLRWTVEQVNTESALRYRVVFDDRRDHNLVRTRNVRYSDGGGAPFRRSRVSSQAVNNATLTSDRWNAMLAGRHGCLLETMDQRTLMSCDKRHGRGESYSTILRP